MFDRLAEKLQSALTQLRGRGRVTEENVRDVLREVRLALLEADVNYRVAKEFIDRVQAKAVGQEVLSSLTPDVQMMKVVSDELTAVMGATAEPLRPPVNGRLILLMVGLNGSGKTTASAKLAKRLREKEGKSPLLVACDVYRPAAIKQLQVLGEQIGVPVFTMGTDTAPANIASASLKFAERHGHDAIIVDTAGRLQTDDELMVELEEIKAAVVPTEVLLVADATTGQEAVAVAEEYHARLSLTGAVLTKMDGDALGGAAISIRAVTDVPIKFFGVGERPDALEEFHAERISSRILGRGDMLSFIEKAEAAMDQEKAQELESKILERQDLNFDDFLAQLGQIRRMGNLDDVMGMIPGLDALKGKGVEADESQLKRVEAIIYSMTLRERQNHRLLDASRKRRIARGSGTTVQQVNELVQQLAQMNRAMKQLTGGGRKKGRRHQSIKQLFPTA
jgi:signal recognition particle subunit SRP54